MLSRWALWRRWLEEGAIRAPRGIRALGPCGPPIELDSDLEREYEKKKVDEKKIYDGQAFTSDY
eukprot:3780226-Prymnesium_polylepis.1